MAARPQEIKSLTGLRGVAAVLVVAYHYSVMSFAATARPSALGPGYLAVDLFFVLSGFVMALNYGSRFERGFSLGAYRGFLSARFARVYPLYIVVASAMYLLIRTHVLHNWDFPNRTLLTNAVLVQYLGAGLVGRGWGDSLVGPGWSISTEVGAYLLFPALTALALFGGWRRAAMVVIASLLSLAALSLMPNAVVHESARRGPLDVSVGVTLWPLVRCLAEFCLGLVAWRLSGMPQVRARSRTLAGDLGMLIPLAVLWCIHGADLFIVMLLPFLLLQTCTDTSPLARFLGAPPVLLLGRLSYAMYLIHWPMLSLLPVLEPRLSTAGIPAPHAVALGLLAVTTLGLAGAAYTIIEKPSRRVLRHLLGRPFRAIEREPAAP